MFKLSTYTLWLPPLDSYNKTAHSLVRLPEQHSNFIILRYKQMKLNGHKNNSAYKIIYDTDKKTTFIYNIYIYIYDNYIYIYDNYIYIYIL